MYSHADRVRAVELYIKLDKRVKATIRQLGYPTTITVAFWFSGELVERQPDGRVSSMTMR
ncbi:transposase-like protein [Rhizobium sp. BK491]|nr:transposase-like protein [Rhizobium sp. BK491]